MTDRIATFRAMLEKNPAQTAVRFGLANELMKAEQWAEAAVELETYLASHDDEGNGWGRLADVLERLGRHAEAQAALERGIAAAQRFGHSGMANELEMRMDEMREG